VLEGSYTRPQPDGLIGRGYPDQCTVPLLTGGDEKKILARVAWSFGPCVGHPHGPTLPPPIHSDIVSQQVSEEIYIVTRLLQPERFHPFTRRRDRRLDGVPRRESSS